MAPVRGNSGLLRPAARFSSRRSSLEMVHWTISFACGEPLLTSYATSNKALEEACRRIQGFTNSLS